jgi:hypothetical protein
MSLGAQAGDARHAYREVFVDAGVEGAVVAKVAGVVAGEGRR